MSLKHGQTDLCTNCLNAGNCVYNKTKKKPVYFCEEFTCRDPGSSLKEAESLKRAKALFLPKSRPGIFDDCGKSIPQDR